MREAFYIDLERRKAAKKRWEEEKKYEDDDFDDERLAISVFEPFDFPKRECKPIVRTRSREQVRKMIE